MSIYTQKQLILSALNYSEYYHLNADTIEKRTVYRFERFWRWVGSFFGLCDSTAAKCHRVSLEQLEKMSHLTSSPKLEASVKVSPSLATQLKAFWIASKVERDFETKKIALIEEIGWIPFLSWINQQTDDNLLSHLLSPLMPASCTNPVRLEPAAENMGHVHFTAGNFLSRQHVCLCAQHLESLFKHLEEKRFFEKAKGRPLTIDLQGKSTPWPLQGSLSKLQNIFQLHLIGVHSVEIESPHQLTKTQIEELSTWLDSQKQLKELRLLSSDTTQRILPLALANVLVSLDFLERLDLGNFIWPLPLNTLPATWNTGKSTIRSSSKTLTPFNLTWEQLQGIQSHCPNVELTHNKQSFFIPEGVLRRISGHFYEFFKKNPSTEHLTVIENTNALLIYELTKASLLGFDGNFNSDFEELVEAAIRFQMPYALAALSQISSGFTYAKTDKILPLTLPSHEQLLPDLSITLNEQTVSVDLYHLAQTAPTRAWNLREYPRHQDIAPEEDSQIRHDDLATYFQGKNCLLTAENLSSFWAMAISFKDFNLFKQIEKWLREQNLIHFSSTQLESWLYLAVSSEDFPDLQQIIRRAAAFI